MSTVLDDAAPQPHRMWLALVAVAMCTIASAAEFDHVYTGHRVTGIGAVAALLSVTIGLAVRRGSVRPIPAACAHLTALALLVAALAWQDGDHRSLRAAFAGVRGGWTATLSTAAPVDPTMRQAAFVVVLLAAATALAAESVLRGGHAFIAVVPLVLVHGVAVYFGVSGRGDSRIVAVVVAAALLTLLAAGAMQRRRVDAFIAGTGGLPVHGIATAAAVAVVVVLAGAWRSESAPYDPRAHRSVPSFDIAIPNPLRQARAWLASPTDPVLFAVEAPPGTDLRFATLDHFDGAEWSLTARLRRTGGSVEAAIGDPGKGSVAVRIAPFNVASPLLPAPVGARTIVAGGDVLVDADSGTLVASEAPAAYIVHAVKPRDASASELAAASLPSATDLRPLVTVPPLPRSLLAVVEQARAAGPSIYQRAVLLRNMLRDEGGFRVRADATVPSGYSYAVLRQLLLKPADQGGHVGSPDQFAAAYAVLLRAAGIPARVVVGFRDVGSAGAAREVRASDVDTWTEILLDRYGWVALDPIPRGNGGSHKGDVLFEEDTDIVPPAGTAGADQAPGGDDTATGGADGGPVKRGRTHHLPWPVIPAVIVALYIAAVLSAPRIRTARRRARADAAASVLGAWADVLDIVRAYGIAIEPSMTRRTIAHAAAARMTPAGIPSVHDVAMRADEARWSAAGIAPSSAEEAWVAAATVTRSVMAGAPLVRRAIAALSPRRVFSYAS